TGDEGFANKTGDAQGYHGSPVEVPGGKLVPNPVAGGTIISLSIDPEFTTTFSQHGGEGRRINTTKSEAPQTFPFKLLTTPDKTFVIPNEITDLGFTFGPDLSHYDLPTIQKLYEAAQRLVDDYTGDLEVLEAREATRLPAHTHIDEVESVRFKQK